MIEAEESQIVRYINTFTVADWQARRPNERIRKGITRVTKSSSQSAQKFAQMLKQRRIEHQLVNDENLNLSNKNKAEYHDPTSPAYLLERIKHLQMELTVLEKEKIELERKVNHEGGEPRHMGNFVESHYIACKEDVEELMNERGRLQEAFNNIEAENNFLKLNMGFQEQYIAKLQGDLNNMRTQAHLSAKIQTFQQGIQSDYCNQNSQDVGPKRELIQVEVQCELGQSNEYEELNQLAMRFQQQTTEFQALIQKLQRENCILNGQNQRLNMELDQFFARNNQCQSKKNDQLQFWNKKIRALQEQFELKLKQASDENERKMKENVQYYSQKLSDKNKEIQQLAKRKIKTPTINKQEVQLQQEIRQLERKYQQSIHQIQECKQREHILRDALSNSQKSLFECKNVINDLHISQQLLKLQQIKNQHLQKEITNLHNQMDKLVIQQSQTKSQQAQYSNLKQQFDGLLIYLQQKNQQLKQKQLRLGQQLQNEQIIYMKNQQTLRKQTQIEAIIAHYEHQIKKIQSSLQNYITQLLTHKRQEKQVELEEMKTRQQLQTANNNKERLYLLNKIDSLQQQLNHAKNQRNNKSQLTQISKLQEKQLIISKLRVDLLELSKKYEHEVLIKNKHLQQNYQISQKLNDQQVLKASFRSELQTIKGHYDQQIQIMQTNIYELEKALQSMQQENIHTRQAFQLRLVQVKRDYDVLYAKYMKYKTLSIHLQGPKTKKN